MFNRTALLIVLLLQVSLLSPCAVASESLAAGEKAQPETKRDQAVKKKKAVKKKAAAKRPQRTKKERVTKKGPTVRKTGQKRLPPLPENVTSFGAAMVDGDLYVYGGHKGAAHAYAKDAQASQLRRLDLENPKAWESLGEGLGLQGLALIAHQGKLYRIGGFTAKNEAGDDHDLWSQADVSRYDVASKRFADISPMPEPRSSFDAALLGDKIYVVGGWNMQGDGETTWSKTAIALDLAAKTPTWTALPAPPFQRRALSVAAHQGKVYAIGGMPQRGGPTTRVDVFDPATDKWSQGPSIQGEGMEGFGSSSFAAGGRLYVSTVAGNLQQLSKDGKSWKTIKKLERARFFHRMLRLGAERLLSVGGSDMKSGKFDEIDIIQVP